jgi:hypothetical protein
MSVMGMHPQIRVVRPNERGRNLTDLTPQVRAHAGPPGCEVAERLAANLTADETTSQV